MTVSGENSFDFYNEYEQLIASQKLLEAFDKVEKQIDQMIAEQKDEVKEPAKKNWGIPWG